jgi:nitrite reductase/ring-hydroxylating ferredoxin subunit
MTYQHSNIKYFLLLTIFLLLFIRCEDNTTRPFPYVHVDVTFDIGTELDGILSGEYVFIEDKGYGGLIIYRSSQNIFKAFDRACVYRPNDKCILERDEKFETLVSCPCCSSRFQIIDNGRGFDGPAGSMQLKQYNVEYYPASQQIRVTNY